MFHNALATADSGLFTSVGRIPDCAILLAPVHSEMCVRNRPQRRASESANSTAASAFQEDKHFSRIRGQCGDSRLTFESTTPSRFPETVRRDYAVHGESDWLVSQRGRELQK